jgi:hypothetical protein
MLHEALGHLSALCRLYVSGLGFRASGLGLRAQGLGLRT